jgi:hypothetical protein
LYFAIRSEREAEPVLICPNWKKKTVVRKVVKEFVEIYNQQRPHFYNHLLTPNQMHQQHKIKTNPIELKIEVT